MNGVPVAMVTLVFTLLTPMATTALASTAGPSAFQPHAATSLDTAIVIAPPSVQLPDFTVLRFHGRSVKLRFTMAGVPLAPFSTTSDRRLALVLMRVNVLVVRRAG